MNMSNASTERQMATGPAAVRCAICKWWIEDSDLVGRREGKRCHWSCLNELTKPRKSKYD